MSRSEAVIRVDCDRCGKTGTDIALTALEAMNWGIQPILEKHGWSVSREDDICPTCTEAIEADKERRRAL